MKISKFLKNKDGVAGLEFAIVGPLLILLAIGSIEFGLLFYNKQVITNACREGARAGIVRVLAGFSDDDVALRVIVKNYCKDRLIDFVGNTSLTDADILLSSRTATFGSDFSVKVTYTYKFLVPALFGLGTTTSISALSLMKMEQEPG